MFKSFIRKTFSKKIKPVSCQKSCRESSDIIKINENVKKLAT